MDKETRLVIRKVRKSETQRAIPTETQRVMLRAIRRATMTVISKAIAKEPKRA
jgi:hypothetical protein